MEQLRTHCNRLNIPLYERGYEKDPAKVAQEAIKSAQRSNIDVLLVDTAGEKQACNLTIVLMHSSQLGRLDSGLAFAFATRGKTVLNSLPP